MGYKTYNCPISKKCGGCEWLAVPYPLQLKRKQKAMEELFGDVVSKDDATLEPIRGMQTPLAYRHKAATPFAPGPKGRIRSGFYQAGTHHIVHCDTCLVEDPRCRPLLDAVARTASWVGVPAYNEDRGTGVLRHAVVRVGYGTDESLLTIVTNGEHLPRAQKFLRELQRNAGGVTTVVQNVNTRRTNAILGFKNVTLWGPGFMHDRLLGCTFEIGPSSFYQTNPMQTEVLYQLAINAAQLSQGARVLDAYCGTGTIGICAAHAAQQQGVDVSVVGVDQVHNAIACARRNATDNGLQGSCRFVCADATEYMARSGISEAHEGGFDAVILDPPRAGSTREFLEGVAALAPERVVYISCNPTTQARDFHVLRQHGYRLRTLQPVDMFPHTKHVETVALLERS